MSIKKKSLKDTIKKKQQLKKSLILHSGSFIVINALLLAINIAFTPKFLWVLFPFFGWLIGLSLHSVIASTVNVKSSIKKGLIFHLALFLVTNLLLFVINIVFDPGTLWALYPAFGWGAALFLHFGAYLTANTLSNHKKSFILHIFLYLGVNVLLLVIDYISSDKIGWALYPIIFWGAGLIMHGVAYGTYLTGKPNKPKKIKDPAKKKGPMGAGRTRMIDKARALRKRAKLLSTVQEKEKISPEPASKISIKGKEKRVEPKPKKGLTLEKIPEGLSEEEEAELKKTESEVDLEEKEAICVVHKAAIVGTVYICPQCKTYYCLKCANALVEKEEKCWTCESEITP